MEQIRWREERERIRLQNEAREPAKAVVVNCSGQQFPDSDLSFSSTTAGGTRPLC